MGAIVLSPVSLTTVHFCHAAYLAQHDRRGSSRDTAMHRLSARMSRGLALLAKRWCYHPRRAARLIGVSEGVARELRFAFSGHRGSG
jgi:hypothetical protein